MIFRQGKPCGKACSNLGFSNGPMDDVFFLNRQGLGLNRTSKIMPNLRIGEKHQSHKFAKILDT